MQILTRFTIAAAAADSLRRASAFVVTASKAITVVAQLQRALGPRSFLHDLALLANPRAADESRMAAARRLARYHITPGSIFFEARWTELEGAFRVWRGDLGFWDGWQDLVAPYILIAFEDIPRDIALDEVWPDLRRRLRRAIELDLLGHTLDGRLRFSARGDRGPIVPAGVAEAADQSLELAGFLGSRTPEAQAFLLEYHRVGHGGRKALAKRQGVSYDTLRQRASRLLRRQRQFLR